MLHRGGIWTPLGWMTKSDEETRLVVCQELFLGLKTPKQ